MRVDLTTSANTQPRFSQSVGLAAKHAVLKVAYKASDYTKGC